MRPIFDNPFDTAFLALGLSVGLLCFLFIIVYLVAYRNDGTSRLGYRPSQSAFLNYLIHGRSNYLVPWQWYDWVFLLGVGVGLVTVGWWLDVGDAMFLDSGNSGNQVVYPDIEAFWLYLVDGLILLIFCALAVCFDNSGQLRRWVVEELG